MVNAIQRRAAVVVQKSLAEGFGLTVTEAMWKGRPLVVSRVGGIQDQIVARGRRPDRRSARRGRRSAPRSARLLGDGELAHRLGEAARLEGAERLPRAAPPGAVGRHPRPPHRGGRGVPSGGALTGRGSVPGARQHEQRAGGGVRQPRRDAAEQHGAHRTVAARAAHEQVEVLRSRGQAVARLAHVDHELGVDPGRDRGPERQLRLLDPRRLIRRRGRDPSLIRARSAGSCAGSRIVWSVSSASPNAAMTAAASSASCPSGVSTKATPMRRMRRVPPA